MSVDNTLERIAAALEKIAENGGSLPAAAAETPAADKPKAESKAADKPAADKGGYWKTSDGSMFGAFKNAQEFKAVQNQYDTKIEKITKAEHDKLAKAEKAAADKKKADDEAKAKAAEEQDDGGDTLDPVTEAELKELAKTYLHSDLDAEERKARHAKVKPKLKELGATKMTGDEGLSDENRPAFYAFLQELIAEAEGAGGDDDDLV